MAKINIKFNNKSYSIDSASIADATTRLEAHLVSMMNGSEVLEGDGAEYYTLAPTPLSFRSTAPLSELQEVTINGDVVDPSNYTLEEGSTIVTLPIEYLKTLEKGIYEVVINSQSKSVKGNFTVAAPELNELGFYYNQPYTAAVYALNAAIAIIFRNDEIANVVDITNGGFEICSYTINGNIVTVSTSIGVLPCTVSNDGISCEALGVTFALNYEGIISDGEYLYMPEVPDKDAYEVIAIVDRSKKTYPSVKTNINNKPTISLRGIEKGLFENIAITEMFIPKSIKNIRNSTFKNCSNLERVIFEDGSQINTIGTGAFEDCIALTNIELPNGLVTIDSIAFAHCVSLTNITIPDSVTSIWARAFYQCNGLISITIGNGIQKIHRSVFDYCTNLRNINFNGTTSQWNAIPKDEDWKDNIPATHVHCIDGDVAL